MYEICIIAITAGAIFTVLGILGYLWDQLVPDSVIDTICRWLGC